MLTEANAPYSIVWINMTDTEYGNELMQAVAQEYFDSHPNVADLVVEVHEHGGWWLSFLRDMTIVGTANDCAVLSEKAKTFIRDHRAARPEWLPSIRRTA